MHKNIWQILIILSILFSLSCTRGVPDFNLNVERFTLSNGLTALLVKRPGPPIFSAVVRIKVGNIEEPPGATGLAHFFEHMAFKGTEKIGTVDYEKENEILTKLHQVGSEIVKRQKEGATDELLRPLRADLYRLQREHVQWVNPGEFSRIYHRNGGSDLNATTSNDYTNYFVSLPSSKLELWAYMESERIKNPVFREFYKERDVVAEERRSRYEDNPDGKLYETFMKLAFDESPYKNNVIGWPEDIQNYTVDVAKDFREKHYIPSRMVVALVGNFDVYLAKKYLRDYFGSIPEKDDQSDEINKEKLTKYPRIKALHGDYEARFYMGFHRPAHPHKDDEVFDVIQSLLCEGRTSRLFQALVKDKKVASSVDCYASLPGSRLDGLFSFYAVPLKPHSNKNVQSEIIKELKRLKEKEVSISEFKKIQKKLETELIWALKSNMGLAKTLTYFEHLTGDWHYLFEFQKRIARITPDDIQRVAKKHFIPKKQVTALMEKQD